MCEASHQCSGNRNCFKFKFSVGEKNIGENPGIQFNITADVGPAHSKSVLDSKLKPATGGRLEQFRLVIKVPVGSSANELKDQAQSVIDTMSSMGVIPIFEITGKPTVEVDSEGLFVVFNAPEEMKAKLAETYQSFAAVSSSIENLEGQVSVCVKIASDANTIFQKLKAGSPPIKEVLRGICVCVCINGNRTIMRQAVQDLVKVMPEMIRPVCVPAYLFNCGKVELNFESSEELPEGFEKNFPIPIPPIPSASDIPPPFSDVLKFKKQVGDAMNGALQIFGATKMFAVQVSLNAKNLSQVLSSLTS